MVAVDDVGVQLITFTSNTLLATALLQSAEQVTLAKRLNHVVCVNAPASYVSELVEVISLKSVVALVVDDCHLYSKVPNCPLTATVLVNAAGLIGLIPLCAVAIVPPAVGGVHA